jgi:hypothetical protein
MPNDLPDWTSMQQAREEQLARFDSSALATATYNVKAGMVSAGIVVDVNELVAGTPDPTHSVLPATVTLRGLPSGCNVITLATVNSRQAYWGPLNPGDNKLAIVTGGILANGCFLDVVVSPTPKTGMGGDQFGNQAVTLGKAPPAPWQAATKSVAPSNAPGALNTDFTIVAAIAGQTIYLHDISVQTNSGTTWEVDLWDGPSAGGLRVARLTMTQLTAVGVSPPVSWNGQGRPLTAGNPLVGTIVQGQAGTTVIGTYGYSQQ